MKGRSPSVFIPSKCNISRGSPRQDLMMRRYCIEKTSNVPPKSLGESWSIFVRPSASAGQDKRLVPSERHLNLTRVAYLRLKVAEGLTNDELPTVPNLARASLVIKTPSIFARLWFGSC